MPIFLPDHRSGAAGREANKQYAAERAIDDPVKLERAARIVRVALARKRLTLDELTTPSAKDGDPR